MIQVLDPDPPLPKQLARPDEGLRAHRERVMDLRILDKGVIDRRGTLAEQNMVRTDGETRYPGGAEPTHRGETEQCPVEVLRLLQVVDGTLIGSRALGAYGDVDGPSAANNRPWSRK
jgi:hypothetical protein